MLKAKETDIQTLKLSTGEEIIARVARTSADWVDVVRPLALVLAEMPGNPAQTQVMFTPWMLGVEETQEISIDRSHVIATGPARKDAAEQYAAATRPAA
jgi:hypothetical protein